MLLVPDNAPHRKQGILQLCMWDLWETLRKIKIRPVYDYISLLLQIFCNMHQETDSVKREIMRLKKDKAYQQFRKTKEIALP